MRSFIAFGFALLLVSCGGSKPAEHAETHLRSKDHPSKEERIRILKQEVKLPSGIKDAEFDLFNVNGFTNSRNSLPGASSWDYKIAVKVDAQDIKAWSNDLPRLTIDTSLDWLDFVPDERKKDWIYSSKPSYFVHDRVIVVIYQAEGIVFKRVIQD